MIHVNHLVGLDEGVNDVSEDNLTFGFGTIADTWKYSCLTAGPYVPIFSGGLKPVLFPSFAYTDHMVGGIPVQLNLESWRYELFFENDVFLSGYLDYGVTFGFDIVDSDISVEGYFCHNYKSVYFEPCYSIIDKLIRDELNEGKYVIATSTPKCVHSLGAVKKSDGSYRPITDCRQPLGRSINNYMKETHHSFTYNTVDYVASLMQRDCYMCTVDISAAYRTVHINPSHWTYQSISWSIDGVSTILHDTRLCFGL